VDLLGAPAEPRGQALSRGANWCSAKLYITVDRKSMSFEPGMTVERGYLAGPDARKPWGLKDDRDWHRLMSQCRTGSPLDAEIARLLGREGFVAAVLGGDGATRFDGGSWTSALKVPLTAR